LKLNPLKISLAASKKDDLESLAYILVYFFRQGKISIGGA